MTIYDNFRYAPRRNKCYLPVCFCFRISAERTWYPIGTGLLRWFMDGLVSWSRIEVTAIVAFKLRVNSSEKWSDRRSSRPDMCNWLVVNFSCPNKAESENVGCARGLSGIILLLLIVPILPQSLFAFILFYDSMQVKLSSSLSSA